MDLEKTVTLTGPQKIALAVIGGMLVLALWIGICGNLGVVGLVLNVLLLGGAVALVVPQARSRIASLLRKPALRTPWRLVAAMSLLGIFGGATSFEVIVDAWNAAAEAEHREAEAERQKEERAAELARALDKARSLASVGRTEDALAAFDRASALGIVPAADTPTLANLMLAKARGLASTNEPEGALKLAQQAMALPGLDAALAATLDEDARSYAEQKRAAEAAMAEQKRLADAAEAERHFAEAIKCASDHAKNARNYIRKQDPEAGASIVEASRCLNVAKATKENDPLVTKMDSELSRIVHDYEAFLDKVAKKAEAEHAGRLNRFHAALKAAGATSVLVHSFHIDPDNDNELVLTVGNAWHYEHYRARLQAAQALQLKWAEINKHTRREQSRIKLLDHMQNEVGGSNLSGSDIWVIDK